MPFSGVSRWLDEGSLFIKGLEGFLNNVCRCLVGALFFPALTKLLYKSGFDLLASLSQLPTLSSTYREGSELLLRGKAAL